MRGRLPNVVLMSMVTKPVVCEYLVRTQSFVGLDTYERAEENARVQAERNGHGHLELAARDPSEHVRDGRMMERVAAHEQCVQDDAKTPGVAELARVARLNRIEHFGTHVCFSECHMFI